MPWEIDITNADINQPLDESGNPSGNPMLQVDYRILDDKGTVVKESSWSFQGANQPTLEALVEQYIEPEARMLRQMRETKERLQTEAVPQGKRFKVK